MTNYRDPSAPTGTRSRGDLVAGFLKSECSAEEYLREVRSDRGEYSGFNLLVGRIGDLSEIFYYSNRGRDPRKLAPGVYGLSNHLLDTPWPKVERGKAAFARLLANGDLAADDLFNILADETLADDADLPSTGVPYEAEKAISAIFIKTEGYGTRCSSVLKFGRDCEWSFEERVVV